MSQQFRPSRPRPGHQSASRSRAPRGPRRATLEDVARATSLSTATVSRCLNTPALVAATTRARVLDAVDRLGYTPDFGGRALASRRTGTIGAVVPTLDNAIFARALQAFTERLAENGHTLLIASSNYDAEVEDRQIRALAARGADALLLIGTERPQRTRDYLAGLGRPYVTAWSKGVAEGEGDGGGDGGSDAEGAGENAGENDGAEATRFVGFDNRAAATDMARAVIERGHRRIAMIAGRTAMNDRAAARVAGVRDALDAHGLDGAAMPVVEAAYEFEAAREAVDRLMAGTPRPSVIVCGNDVLAVGAISRLKQMGLDVPGDVSVTGFDDVELAAVVDPALTTVHVPHRRMGVASADLLLAMLRGETGVESATFETSLVHRASLGPAR